MKSKMTVLLPCAAMCMAAIALAEITPGGKPPANNEVSQMRSELNVLKAKVEMLEFRTKSLESSLQQLKQPHSPTPLSSPGPMLPAPTPFGLNPLSTESDSPKIWGSGKVNGWTYYIVPCEQPSR
jgi:hypothetical protein